MNYSIEEIVNAINKSNKIEKVKSINISEDMFQQGILGNLRKLELELYTAQDNKQELIYKKQCCTDKFREAEMYNLLAKDCKSLIPLKICEFNNGDIIIENLKDYHSGRIVDGCDIEEAKQILKGIAKVHSIFWGKDQLPEISYKQFADVLRYNLNEDLDSYLERYGDVLGDLKSDFIWLLNNAETVSKILHDGLTLTHGDLHLENVMFSKSGEVKIIDWQLSSRRSPAFDVSFFIIQNVEVGLRREHEEDLLKYYYNHLSSIMREDYPYSRFILEYRGCLTRSMMSSVMMIGKRFAHKENQMHDADIIANRVISAVRDLKPVEAIDGLQ